MFNVGGGELIVIMLIALIVLGPKRLPDAARQIGKAMGDLRRMSTSFQNEVRTALDTADDPNQVGTRRDMLTAHESAAEAPAAKPPARRKPLVAAPVTESSPPPSKSAKKAQPKNGAAVKKKPAASKSPARRSKT